MFAVLAQLPVFVHPALAVGAFATGAIPIIIHLINRRRHARVPWAAMVFLLAANRRSVRRVRLEQWLLLLTRVAILLLFGMALARPFLPDATVFPSSTARVLRVVVLDNSLSMNARDDAGNSRFHRARTVAAELIDAFPASDPVALISCARPARPLTAQPSTDRRIIRERLLAVEPTQRSVDVPGALDAAIETFAASQLPETNRAVYVISDFPRSVWHDNEQGRPTPAVEALRRLSRHVAEPDKNVILIPADGGETENVAVTSLTPETSLMTVGRPSRLAVTVTNFGAAARSGATLQIARSGEVIRRETLPLLAPGRTVSLGIAMVFDTPGTAVIEAGLAGVPGDALIEDNMRFLSVEVRDRVPVLLVDGRPGLSRLSGQAGYLATALAPRTSDLDPVVLEPLVVTPPELAGENLSQYGFAAMCNVHRLAEDTWDALRTYVDAGGGLLVFLGNMVDIDHYNGLAGQSGSGLIPGTLSPPHRTSDDAPVRIAYDMLGHALVRDFEGHPESGLFSADVTAYVPLEVDQARGEVVLRYTDGKPAVVVSAQARVVVVTTTANMEWNSLPARGDFVSLVSSLSAHLVQPVGTERNLLVGDDVREPLTARESSLPLRVTFPVSPISAGPRGKAARGSPAAANAAVPMLLPGPQSLTLSHGPMEQAGAVTVSVGAIQRHFAVNVDTLESRIAALDRAALAGDLPAAVHLPSGDGSGRPVFVRAGAADLAPALLLVAVGLLLLEMWLAMRFGGVRGSSEAPRGRGDGMS